MTVGPRFDGRVVIVSGASSGIGLALAERLASEGARLVLVAAPIDEGDLEDALGDLRRRGHEVEGFAASIAEESTAERAVALAVERFGRLDAAVNNAGIGFFEEVFDTPVEHLDRTLAVNVRGTFLMCVAAARAMAETGGGAISNTLSCSAVLGEEYQVTYNLSKAAVVALTRSLAVDLASYRIRVNGVAPGWVRTRSTAPLLANGPLWAKYRARIPFDRPADTAEIAAVHAFLLSDDASYLSGAVVAADGGLTAGLRWSGWAAVEEPDETQPVGIPRIPKTLGRKIDP